MSVFLHAVLQSVQQPEKCWTESNKHEELVVCSPTDHGLVLGNDIAGSCLHILASWVTLAGTAWENARENLETVLGVVLDLSLLGTTFHQGLTWTTEHFMNKLL